MVAKKRKARHDLTECRCPRCGKDHTSEVPGGYTGPARVAPIYCLGCKIALGFYTDTFDKRDHVRLEYDVAVMM